VTGEQVIVLALLVAAFVAGWVARGSDAPRRARGGAGDEDDEGAPTAPEPAAKGGAPRGPVRPPAPLDVARRALERAIAAYESAVDRWLDERDQITPAGRAALGELDRGIRRLELAASRLPDDAATARAAALGLDALRDAAGLLEAYRQGRAIDAPTSTSLAEIEDDLAEARDELGAPAAAGQGAPP
jgi:hypothetical protein